MGATELETDESVEVVVASEIAEEAEASIELTDVGLNVMLPLETKLAKALERAEVGTALGIKAAASVIKVVPFITANGVGMAVTPADDKALCKAAIDEGTAVIMLEAESCGKMD